jgi:GNAT superfamily N-acetyltransferase
MRGVARVTLRPGRPSDAETLYEIHRESVLVAYAPIFPQDQYPFPAAAMRQHWIERLGDDRASTVIAERDRTATGFGVVSPGWLESMFVRPEAWGQGVGRAVHDEAVELLRAAGAGARLWVLEQNEAARRFYEHRGWRHDGERQKSSYPPHPQIFRYTLDLGATGPHP